MSFFTQSLRGKPLIVYKKYSYCKHSIRNNIIRWTCSTHSYKCCKAVVKTSGTHIIEEKGHHNHDASELLINRGNPTFARISADSMTYRFSLSKNKRMVMVVNGYKFSLHYSRNSKERWQCSRRSYFGCKAVIHTRAGICPICGDNTSGLHYGIHTCESCKSFFKRAIGQDISSKFRCVKLSGSCVMSQRTRSSCRFCRFTKCLSSGMLPSLVRLRRERGGRSQIYKN